MMSARPYNIFFPSHRDFRLHNSNMKVFFVFRIRETPNPDFFIFSDTRPKWMDGSYQTSGFANCKAKTTTYVSPNDRFPDLDNHTTCVLPGIHGWNPFVVSGLKRSRTLGLETFDMPMALDFYHVSQSNGWL
jgi:hypothetical protein